MQFPEYENKLFSFDNASSDAYKIGQEILTYSLSIPTIEIWNDETFNGLIRQIEYYWVSGYFAHDEKLWVFLRNMNSIVKKSILISSVSEKERNRFFNKLSEKISSLKVRVS